MKKTWFYRNSLSIVMLSFLLIFVTGQFYTGMKVKNEEQQERGLPELSFSQYIRSNHFFEAIFENWESEFLQMSSYVILTIFLRQKGSSESKSLDKNEEVDRKPKAHPKAPWPVKKGGIWLRLYSSSLSIAFGILFLLSFFFHFRASLGEYNEEQLFEHKPVVTAFAYLGNSEFWFESFQNWQSEFLAVASILILSIWLRQKGSPESKPVDAPHDETGG